MNTRTEVNEARKETLARSVAPVTRSLLQRKCDCGGSPGVTGNCSECEDKRLSVQRYACGRSESLLDRHHGQTIQTKLAVSEPGDRFEREADRVADALMQRSESTNIVGEQEEDELLQTKLVDEITPLIQRQMQGPEEEEEEEEEETVQTKRAANESEVEAEEDEEQKLDRVAARLNQARGGGAALPSGVRANMEKGFGVDFGQVRVHFDRAANDLTHILHAAAFTTGTDIFFREGLSDLTKESGRRLLAHELTHVVQQNPQLKLSKRPWSAFQQNNVPDPKRTSLSDASKTVADHGGPALLEVIQRADPPTGTKREFIGRLHLYKNGKKTFVYKVFHSSTSPLKPGKYSARVTGEPPNAKIRAKGKELLITEIDWEEFQKERKGAKLRLVISVDKTTRAVEAGDEGKEGDKDKGEGTGGEGPKTKGKQAEGEGEKTKGETEGEEGGVEGGQGEGEQTDGEKGEGEVGGEKGEEETEPGDEGEGEGGGGGAGGGDKPPPEPPTDTEPPGEPGPEPPTPESEEEEPAAPEAQDEEATVGGKEREMEVEGGSEDGTGKGSKSGSKYGSLGLLPLPESVKKALESALDLLIDSAEYEALRKLLENLRAFDSHAKELRTWFDEPDKLIRILLGLESSEAITLLETWVRDVPEKRRRKLRSKGRGLTGIVRKVNRMLDAVRTTLTPIFDTRARFIEAFGAGAAILEEIPAFDQLLEGVAKPGTPQFQGLLDDLTTNFTAGIQQQLADARATFKGKIKKLSESDLVTSEELARAIVSAARKALPPHARFGAKILDDVGVLDAAADDVVAPLIPNEILDSVNGIIQDVFSALEPVFLNAEKVMDEILTSAESVLKDELAPLIKEIFMPHRTSPVAHSSPRGSLDLLALMQRSHGRSLEPNLRREMATTMGFDFGSVRIHHDLPSQRANQLLEANAFTVGSDIFFGAGTFAPETDFGHRLLAHELTHVVQQGQGVPTEPVQRDVKGLTKKVAEKYAEFLQAAKKFKASPQRKAEAAEMRAQVEKLIGQPFSKVEKKLPYVYSVSKKKPGKIVIRRKSEWIFLVPKLRVVKGKLEFNFLRRPDPHAAERRKLRASLGTCKADEQAHHIIPLELLDELRLCEIAKPHFDFNKAENGVCVASKIHSGSHPKYTGRIRGQLETLSSAFLEDGELVWSDELEKEFRELVVRNRAKLKRRKTKLR